MYIILQIFIRDSINFALILKYLTIFRCCHFKASTFFPFLVLFLNIQVDCMYIITRYLEYKLYFGAIMYDLILDYSTNHIFVDDQKFIRSLSSQQCLEGCYQVCTIPILILFLMSKLIVCTQLQGTQNLKLYLGAFLNALILAYLTNLIIFSVDWQFI